MRDRIPRPCITGTVRTAAALQRVAAVTVLIGAATCVSGMAGDVALSAVKATPAVPAGHQAATKLSLSMSASPRTVTRGKTVSFALHVRNIGTSPAIRVRICNQMPGALVPLPAFRFVRRGNVQCGTIQRLPVQGGVVMDLKGQVSQSAPGGVVTNRASAKAVNSASVQASAQVTIRVLGPCGRSLC